MCELFLAIKTALSFFSSLTSHDSSVKFDRTIRRFHLIVQLIYTISVTPGLTR